MPPALALPSLPRLQSVDWGFMEKSQQEPVVPEPPASSPLTTNLPVFGKQKEVIIIVALLSIRPPRRHAIKKRVRSSSDLSPPCLILLLGTAAAFADQSALARACMAHRRPHAICAATPIILPHTEHPRLQLPSLLPSRGAARGDVGGLSKWSNFSRRQGGVGAE